MLTNRRCDDVTRQEEIRITITFRLPNKFKLSAQGYFFLLVRAFDVRHGRTYGKY